MGRGGSGFPLPPPNPLPPPPMGVGIPLLTPKLGETHKFSLSLSLFLR